MGYNKNILILHENEEMSLSQVLRADPFLSSPYIINGIIMIFAIISTIFTLPILVFNPIFSYICIILYI